MFPDLHPGQRQVHGEHVNPHLELALLYARLVWVVEGARLHVFRHQTGATRLLLPVVEDAQSELLLNTWY